MAVGGSPQLPLTTSLAALASAKASARAAKCVSQKDFHKYVSPKDFHKCITNEKR